jgi:hypothetical protein
LGLLLVSIIFCHNDFSYFLCSFFMYGMWGESYDEPHNQLCQHLFPSEIEDTIPDEKSPSLKVTAVRS